MLVLRLVRQRASGASFSVLASVMPSAIAPQPQSQHRGAMPLVRCTPGKAQRKARRVQDCRAVDGKSKLHADAGSFYMPCTPAAESIFPVRCPESRGTILARAEFMTFCPQPGPSKRLCRLQTSAGRVFAERCDCVAGRIVELHAKLRRKRAPPVPCADFESWMRSSASQQPFGRLIANQSGRLDPA